MQNSQGTPWARGTAGRKPPGGSPMEVDGEATSTNSHYEDDSDMTICDEEMDETQSKIYENYHENNQKNFCESSEENKRQIRGHM